MYLKLLFLTLAASTFTTKVDANNNFTSNSPCPELFRFDFFDTSEKRVDATLAVRAHHVLNGLWIRLLFDRDIEELTVKDNFGEVERREPNKGFLIKNPDIVLRSGQSKIVKLSLKISGDDIPNLVEYRVNSVTVCPSLYTQNNAYPNDQQVSPDFLQSIVTDQKPEIDYKCGQVSNDQKPEAFPWQASIYRKQNDQKQYTCHATLISPQHLITAAHCVTYLQTSVPVAADSLIIYFEQEKKNPHSVRRITIYPGYRRENLLNDIAIIELDNVVTKEQIQPVCLPTEAATVDEEEIVVGLEIQKGPQSPLKSTTVKKIPVDQCFKDKEFLRNLLGDNSYCISYQKDICVGNSGGSAISLKSGRWELKGVLYVGLLLQNEQKCDDSVNALLTDVSRYSKWIKQIIFA